MQIKFYGENSIQLAKTLKIIGALHLVQGSFIDAQRYYNRAIRIFEDNGAKQAVQDLKKKIKVAREMREKTLTTKFPDTFK